MGSVGLKKETWALKQENWVLTNEIGVKQAKIEVEGWKGGRVKICLGMG